MIALLFAVGWWLALALAAFGALLALVFVALEIDEILHGVPEYRLPRGQRVPPRPVLPAVEHNRWCRNCRLERERFKPARPFDQCDPLEQAFALPCAPDPRVL